MKTKLTVLLLLISASFSSKAQNVGIGTDIPAFPLHVIGTTWSTTLWGNNGRFNTYLRVGSSYDANYKFYVDNGDSWLGGDLSVSGTSHLTGSVGIGTTPVNGRKLYVQGAMESNGYLFATGASISGPVGLTEAISVGTNANIANNLNVGNDGIVSGNFRVNGRVGINGATNGNYGLIVNNANSYFQGNATVTGNMNVSGNLTVKGKGHVRSQGSSNLLVGFASRAFNDFFVANGKKEFTISLDDFDGGNGDVLGMIAQFDPDPAPAYANWRYFNFILYDVDAAANTCRVHVYNYSGVNTTLKGTLYLTSISKE